jgi:hypothetical protein
MICKEKVLQAPREESYLYVSNIITIPERQK